MSDSITWKQLVLGSLFLLSLSAGITLSIYTGEETDSSQVSITVCERADGYHFEQALRRVENIKNAEMKRNLTVCTEQTATGIDTTSGERRFASLRSPGLSFFELESQTNTGVRTSIGYTTFSPDGGPITVRFADESVVENVSWLSYETLVAHEFSHAIDDSHLQLKDSNSTRKVEVRRTTDWLLANRAISEGSATYVSELYVEQYGGKLNVSKLGEDSRGWKHRILVSVYSEGYRYSKRTGITSSNGHRVNSTAAVLHPTTEDPSQFPAKSNFSSESYEHARVDRVGELFIREMLRSKGLSSAQATYASEGWTNDRLDYYRSNSSDVVTWHVVWQTQRDRSEFVTAYNATYQYTRVNTVESITCDKPGRYLATSEKSVTVVSCSG